MGHFIDDNSGRIFNWYKVLDVSVASLVEGSMQEALVHGKQIALLKRQGNIYAFAPKCPHAGARLCDGWLDVQGRIVCPDHKYRFDPANGRNTTGEGYKLFTYPVQIREDEVWIALLATM